MTTLDEQLQMLKQQLSEKESKQETLSLLYQRKAHIDTKFAELSAERAKEQADIDRLYNGGLAAFFYRITGKQDELLLREATTLNELTSKLNSLSEEHAELLKTIAQREADIDRLTEYEAQFDALLLEKKEAMKSAGAPEVEELLIPEAAMIRIPSRMKATEDLMTMAEEAKTVAEHIVFLLEKAEASTRKDIHLTHRYGREKYHHLENAHVQAEILQNILKTLHSNLADQFFPPDLRISVSDSLCFFEIYFDNVIADLAVLSNLQKSLLQARKALDNITSLLFRLAELRKKLAGEYEAAKAKVEELVLNYNR